MQDNSNLDSANKAVVAQFGEMKQKLTEAHSNLIILKDEHVHLSNEYKQKSFAVEKLNNEVEKGQPEI